MSELQSLLNTLELGLAINKPDFVRNAWFSFERIGESVWDDGTQVEEGYIRLHVVTYNSSFILEWSKYWAFIREDRDAALGAFAKSLIEEEDYIKVWYSIDFEKEEWKEKFTKKHKDKTKEQEDVRECYQDFCNTFKKGNPASDNENQNS